MSLATCLCSSLTSAALSECFVSNSVDTEAIHCYLSGGAINLLNPMLYETKFQMFGTNP